MVLVHEFGHFAMAKLFRVKVEVFSIGFGKRLLGFRRGDTDYRLSLLPLGGYVKMQGELGGDGTMPLSGTGATGDPVAARDSGDLNAKPRWQRVLIAVAGPVANFILALVLMTGLYMMHNEVEAIPVTAGERRLHYAGLTRQPRRYSAGRPHRAF